MRMLVPGPVRSHFKNLLLNFTPSELKNFIKYNYYITIVKTQKTQHSNQRRLI